MKELLLHSQVTGYLLMVLASLGQRKSTSVCRRLVCCEGQVWGGRRVMSSRLCLRHDAVLSLFVMWCSPRTYSSRKSLSSRKWILGKPQTLERSEEWENPMSASMGKIIRPHTAGCSSMHFSRHPCPPGLCCSRVVFRSASLGNCWRCRVLVTPPTPHPRPTEFSQFSRSVVSDSSWPHGLQHARLPCPSPIPGACSNSRPLSQWCHPTISSSVIPSFSCLQSFPAPGSFPMSQFFASGGQSIGDSASASVLPMNIQDFFPWGLTGLISLQSKRLSRVFSNPTVQNISSLVLSFLYGSTLTSILDY